MAGVLQFTLGLEASKFIGEIQGATVHLAHFFVAGVEGAIATGARLEHMSNRTGVAVGELYGLEKAFKASGIAGESVSTVLFQMQKSLGGFSEFGAPTKDVFAAMGLEVEKLKAAKPADALLEITEALSHLSNSEATKASSLIFGRGGAQDALQLARSLDVAQEAMKRAGTTGAIFERSGEAFAKIERTIEQVKGKLKDSFFAGIAEGAAPAAQAILDALNKIDIKNIGQSIGSSLGSVVGAIKDGQIGELLKLSLGSAAEIFGNLLVASIAAAMAFMEVRMKDLFTTIPLLLSAGLSSALAAAGVGLAAVFDKLGLTKVAGKLEAFGTEQLFAADKKGKDYLSAEGSSGLNAIAAAGKAFGENSGGITGANTSALKEFLDAHKLNLAPPEPHAITKSLQDTQGAAAEKAGAVHASKTTDALTRLGFNSGSGVSQEHARVTATATRETVIILKDMQRLMLERATSSDGNFANIA